MASETYYCALLCTDVYTYMQSYRPVGMSGAGRGSTVPLETARSGGAVEVERVKKRGIYMYNTEPYVYNMCSMIICITRILFMYVVIQLITHQSLTILYCVSNIRTG